MGAGGGKGEPWALGAEHGVGPCRSCFCCQPGGQAQPQGAPPGGCSPAEPGEVMDGLSPANPVGVPGGELWKLCTGNLCAQVRARRVELGFCACRMGALQALAGASRSGCASPPFWTGLTGMMGGGEGKVPKPTPVPGARVRRDPSLSSARMAVGGWSTVSTSRGAVCKIYHPPPKNQTLGFSWSPARVLGAARAAWAGPSLPSLSLVPSHAAPPFQHRRAGQRQPRPLASQRASQAGGQITVQHWGQTDPSGPPPRARCSLAPHRA